MLGDIKHKLEIRYPCSSCDYSVSTPHIEFKLEGDIYSALAKDLKWNIEIIHEGVRYGCKKCEYAGTSASRLKIHIQGKPEVVRLPCDKCDFTLSSAKDLRRHNEIKYQEVRYPCDKCEHAATTASNLRKHIEGKHEGVKYSYEKCECIVDSVRQHIKIKHERGEIFMWIRCNYKKRSQEAYSEETWNNPFLWEMCVHII